MYSQIQFAKLIGLDWIIIYSNPYSQINGLDYRFLYHINDFSKKKFNTIKSGHSGHSGHRWWTGGRWWYSVANRGVYLGLEI